MNITDRSFLGSIFTDTYYRLYDLHLLYTLHTVFSICNRTGIADHIGPFPVSSRELLERLNGSPQAECSVNWMLNFLAQEGYIAKTNDREPVYRTDRTLPQSRTEEIAEEILDIDRNWLPFIKLLKSIASQYTEFLKGNKSGVEMLFYKNNMQLWNNYFNNSFSGYSIYNICGAYGAAKWFSLKAAGSILELGGGTGGAAIKLLHAFKDAGIMDKIEKYVFSDVSPVLLRTANHLFMEEFPEIEDRIELKVLDFNKTLGTQKIQEKSFDAVYSVNAVHVSSDLLLTLKGIHSIMKDNGILVISELVRDSDDHSLPQELIFTLLESYHQVKTDSKIRKTYGFLTPVSWIRHFELAGFRNIELITNTDHSKKSSTERDRPLFMMVIKGQK